VHSTGHEKRLNRKTITEMAEFGGEIYSHEELVAELGNCYLSSYTGIGNNEFSNNVAYIQGWLSKLKNEKRFVVIASTQAQKACDYILQINKETSLGTETEVSSNENQKPE
jgi:antirestriction protein ArdC